MSGNNSVSVEPISFGTPEMDAFVRLPWRIQKDDPCWVPPTLKLQLDFLNPRKGPFFEIGEVQYFLASKNGEPAGRLSAHISHAHDKYHDDNAGFFGFFECINDQEVANALLDTAAAWLRERGRSIIRGPMSFGIYDEVGVLVDGFDSLPALLQTHNPPFYKDLLENWGLDKATDWFALRSQDRNPPVEQWREKLDKILAEDAKGLQMVKPDFKSMFDRAEEVLELFNHVWGKNWGHVPFTRKQFEDNLKELKPLFRPELVRFFLDGDELVAFMVTIPDINPTLQTFNGNLNLYQMLKVYLEGRWGSLKKLRTILMGVREGYQRRRLHDAMIISTYLDLLKYKTADCCDCSLIMEDHRYFIRSLRAYNVHKYKTWRIFEKPL